MIAGKYVPPHMRNRPATAAAPPSEPKFNQKTKKTKKTKKVEAVQKPAAQEVPKVKPHCELFLADLPAPMRSVTTLAGKLYLTFLSKLSLGSIFPIRGL